MWRSFLWLRKFNILKARNRKNRAACIVHLSSSEKYLKETELQEAICLFHEVIHFTEVKSFRDKS